MIRDLVIIGCGGFGREAADIVDAINQVETTWNLLGFVDDDPSEANATRVVRRGSRIVGNMAEATQQLSPHYIVGIGNGAIRKRMVSLADANGWKAATLKHPTATIGASISIGEGSILCAQVIVGSDVSMGQHVHLDRAVQVGHDSIISDFVTAHPAAVISGECQIDERAELGTNCTLLPGVSIGADVVVGASACVTRDVEACRTVRGIPAR